MTGFAAWFVPACAVVTFACGAATVWLNWRMLSLRALTAALHGIEVRLVSLSDDLEAHNKLQALTVTAALNRYSSTEQDVLATKAAQLTADAYGCGPSSPPGFGAAKPSWSD